MVQLDKKSSRVENKEKLCAMNLASFRRLVRWGAARKKWRSKNKKGERDLARGEAAVYLGVKRAVNCLWYER